MKLSNENRIVMDMITGEEFGVGGSSKEANTKPLNAKEFMESKGWSVSDNEAQDMEAYLKYRVEVVKQYPSDPIKEGLMKSWIADKVDFVRGFDSGYLQALKEITG